MKPTPIRIRLYLGTEVAPAHRKRLNRDALTVYDRSALIGRVASAFPAGFTVYDAVGTWAGPDGRTVTEGTIVVEIIGDETALPLARELAAWHKAANGQDSVLLTADRVAVEFV